MKSARFLVVALLLSVWCIAGCASAHRQGPARTFRVAGYVLDSVSRQPVAGVFVKTSEQENYFGMPRTDERGYFVLDLLPESRAKATRVMVNTLLYEGWAPLPAIVGAEVVLLLHRNKQHRPIAECAGSGDSLRMAPYASRATLGPGYELAFRLQNASALATDTVRTILLNAKQLNFDQKWGWYRLRAYLLNGAGQGPGTDVLTDNVRIDLSPVYASAISKAGYCAFDMRKYHIVVPPGGIYIAFQGIVAEGYPIHFFPTEQYVPTGQLLHLPCPAKSSDVWLYVRSWESLPAAQIPFPLYYQGIQVELVGNK